MAKQKIIRACTVPQSLGFVTGMLPDLQKKYEVVLLSSSGLEWEEVRRLHPDVKCIEVDMERHISQPVPSLPVSCQSVQGLFRDNCRNPTPLLAF